jgi:hypothetical protein
MLLRPSLLLVAALTSLVWLPVEASAQNGAWCARVRGSMSCGFATFQQCMATVLGDGGICVQNPAGPRGATGPAAGPAAAAAAKKAAAGRAERAERAREAAEERRRAKQRQQELARQRQRAKQQEAVKAAPNAPAPAAAVPAVASDTGGGVPVADLDVNAVPALNRDAIRRVQTVLKEKGFDPGPANGVANPRTQEAVRAFQARYGIEARGAIDNQTLLALGEAGLASQSGR